MRDAHIFYNFICQIIAAAVRGEITEKISVHCIHIRLVERVPKRDVLAEMLATFFNKI